VTRDAGGLAEAPRRVGDAGDLEEAPRRGARWPGGGAAQGRPAAWLRRRARSAVAGGGGGDVGDLAEAPRRGTRWPGGGVAQGRPTA
jgi:hypothetical protein